MNTWFRSALFAGAALAVFGLASQSFAQTSQVVVVDDTSCNKLFPNTPGIDELNFGRGGLEGVHVKGELTVEIIATSFVKNKPSEIDWVSQSTNGSPARVNAVIVRDSPSVSHLYPYPTGAVLDSGLTGAKEQGIDRVRFCFGGPAVALAAFAECPVVATEDLECEPGDAFTAFYDLENPDSPPAICACPEVDGQLAVISESCTDLPGAPDACFGPEDSVVSTRGAIAVGVANPGGGSHISTVYCYAIDGIRICQEFTLAHP